MINLPIISIKQLILNHINHLASVKSELSKNKMVVQTRGYLEPDFISKKKNYSIIYDVILKDESTDDYVFINLPVSLIEKHNLIGGEFIEITGSAEINNYKKSYVKLQINIIALKINNSAIAVNTTISSQATDQIIALKAVPKKRVPFPFGKPLNIALIQPNSNTVVQDFKLKLPTEGVYIKDYPINIGSKSAILDSIQSIMKDNQSKQYKYNILAIIRGGGDGFEVFDDLDVCRAFANIDMHKIVGLGHEENRCLIEFVSDHAEATPSYLNTYLVHQLDSVAKNKSHVKYYKNPKTTNGQDNKLETKLNWIIVLLFVGFFIVMPVIMKMIK